MGASILVYSVSGCVLVGRHYNEGGDKGGNIPPGYNSKFVAPDKDGKAQVIVMDKEDQILPAFQIVTKGR